MTQGANMIVEIKNSGFCSLQVSLLDKGWSVYGT